jgi:hypothetical protein
LPTGVYYDTRLQALQAAKDYLDSSASKPEEGLGLKDGKVSV